MHKEYMNLLHYNNCKLSTCFGRFLAIFREICFRKIYSKATKLIYNYTILSFKYEWVLKSP